MNSSKVFDFLDGMTRSNLDLENFRSKDYVEDVPTFQYPNVLQPSKFANSHIDVKSEKDSLIKLVHGTTTLAFKFKDGIIVATDSRATAGNVIASQTVKKVIEINPYLLGTMAGGAADCSYWERELGRRCRLHELANKERISVAAASKLLANIGPGLYYVDSDGTRVQGDLFSVGSGSTFAYGILDSGYDVNMETVDAIELGRRAIFHATHRDAFSGGYVRLYHIKPEGWEFIGLEDVGELYYKYKSEV
ncbi:hypothetical protein BB560_002338 [Smittium megazygosporum]|uniref:Proteasome subunit beta n=1 Tax=Smittium megazygosporum TaxID=133381 RepID=A0A2T9ZF83_9FUNG|nr:hypothetical protein BB560_002338 [Smittium megazygosporum]